MKKRCFIFLSAFLLVSCATQSYDQAISNWKSYEDVALWMRQEVSFDYSRIKNHYIRNHEKFYRSPYGNCKDATNFAVKTLNAIDPNYNARPVAIFSRIGNGHYVAAFDYQENLYIMDYGTGRSRRAMQGVHGPYSSLDEYFGYLKNLNIRGFSPYYVAFRNMPGLED